MTVDQGDQDHSRIRMNAIPDRWQELFNQLKVASYETFRPVLAVSAAVDFRDIYASLGYDSKRVKSAYDDAPYPFGMNPIKPDTLKPEIWLDARREEATKDVASLYEAWFTRMPIPLQIAPIPNHIKAFVLQAANPIDKDNFKLVERLVRVLEARYAFDLGDKFSAGLLIHTDEENAARKLYAGYVLESEKSAPTELPLMDDMFYNRLPQFFQTAKEFEVWRGLRRACDLPDDEIARRAQQFRSLTGKS